MIEKFIASLVDDEKAKDKMASRGPFLAQLEFEKQLKERGFADTRQGMVYCTSKLVLSPLH